MLPFEKLKAYQLALLLVRDVDTFIQTVPRGHADDIDQLRRAASSISRNLAEGAGREQPADRIHFYVIARGSVTECVPSIEILARKSVAGAALSNPLRIRLKLLHWMITKLIEGVKNTHKTKTP